MHFWEGLISARGMYHSATGTEFELTAFVPWNLERSIHIHCTEFWFRTEKVGDQTGHLR